MLKAKVFLGTRENLGSTPFAREEFILCEIRFDFFLV